MQLIISEKPSVGKSIATVLGATRKCNGYIEVIFIEYCLPRKPVNNIVCSLRNSNNINNKETIQIHE